MGASSIYNRQTHEGMQYMHIKTCLPMEEHARHILTPFAFNALQHELGQAMKYATSEMANGSYLVRHFKNMDSERLLIWIAEDEQILCSCKEFETSGILCRHALRILLLKNYFQLPEKYFLSRWKQESSLVPLDDQSNWNGNEEWFQEFHTLSGILFSESSLTKERSDHVRSELSKEITRLLNEVREMPATNDITVDLTVSPTG